MAETAVSTSMPLAPTSEARETGTAGARRSHWGRSWVLLLALASVLAAACVVLTGGRGGAFLPSLATVVCLTAAFTDARSGRIPNKLTYPAILLGLAANTLVPLVRLLPWRAVELWLGAAGPEASFAGFFACVAVGFAAVALGNVHGGDLKLLAAVGALLGLVQAANVLMLALVVALGYALINLAAFGRLTSTLRLAAQRMMELQYFRQFYTSVPEDPVPMQPSHIPMAIPLALGLIGVQIWQWKMGAWL